MQDGDLEHLTLAVNGIQLHAVAAGPEDGPLVVLLHGFPEFWFGWREQLPALASAGYRAVALDQRGYGASSKPTRIEAYALEELAGDVLGLIDALGRSRAFVVGHDWGANVAWRLGMLEPERVAGLTILNVPHPQAFLRALRTRPSQWRRSWYIVFFQLPKLPEALLARNRMRPLRDSLIRTSRPGTFTEDELARYQKAWERPGALRAMIDWYRAPRLRGNHSFPAERICVPTQIIWGAQDAFLIAELAQWSLDWCDDGHLHLLEDATHWVHHEEPDRVNALLTEFFGRIQAAVDTARTHDRM